MDESFCKAGKPYRSQAQQITMNVHDFMNREAANGSPLIPINLVQKRVSEATGVSKATFYRIKKRIRQGVLETPGKIRPRNPRVQLDDFEQAALRREIVNMYSKQEIPTAKRLRRFLQDNFNYTGSVTSVQRMLRKMGFKWKKQNNRKLLLERIDIVTARRSYLRAIRENAASQSPCDVVYLDETYLHKSETVTKTWQLTNPRENEKALCCLKTPVGKGPRLIIVHCGGEKGWIDGTHRIWKNTNPKSADYHGDMNSDNFQDWFRRLCNLLPEPSIIVMDNASYHTTSADKIPNTSTRKDDIKAWLEKEGIPYPDQALKAELLTIVKSTHREKRYILDEIAHEHGHRIQRLPPYHCDLNPIKLLWAQGKKYVRTNNRDFTLASVEKLWCEWEKSVTSEGWKKCVQHVKKIESAYWVNDGIVEQEIERLIINFGDLSSDSETELESESGSDLDLAPLSQTENCDLGVFPLPDD